MSAGCIGCAFAQRRFRSTTPRQWCKRYHRVAEARCIDYRSKASAIKASIDFVKRLAIK